MIRKEWLVILLRIPADAGLLLIRVYQLTLSPLKRFIFGPSGGCRFYPTCSAYGFESIQRYGLLLGGWRTVCRILKCHPFHPGGFDPVDPCEGNPGTPKKDVSV